jgi:hypothetical protein
MSDELHCSDHRWSDPQPRVGVQRRRLSRQTSHGPATVLPVLPGRTNNRSVEMTGRREPCGHVWGPWETVWGGTLGDPSTRYDTGDRVRLCILCGCWEAKWAGEGK